MDGEQGCDPRGEQATELVRRGGRDAETQRDERREEHKHTGAPNEACFFPDDVEKTFDRSIERFIETYGKRGRWW